MDLSVEEQFRRLADARERATLTYTSAADLLAHPTYQAIIALGPPAVPLILDELGRTLDFDWLPALRAITGENPVPPEDRGRVRKELEAWTKWLAAHEETKKYEQIAEELRQRAGALKEELKRLEDAKVVSRKTMQTMIGPGRRVS